MSVFGRAIIREIGRNVGKGISNDLFGDWHATPVRMVRTSLIVRRSSPEIYLGMTPMLKYIYEERRKVSRASKSRPA